MSNNPQYDPGPDESGNLDLGSKGTSNQDIKDQNSEGAIVKGKGSEDDPLAGEQVDKEHTIGATRVDASIANSIGIGSVIYRDIQEELFNRMDELNRNSIKGTSTRTTWARMASGQVPVQEYKHPTSGKIMTKQLYEGMDGAVTLMGGTLSPVDEDGYQDLKGGFNQIYSRNNFNFGQMVTDNNGNVNEVGTHGEKFVPMAGITDIDMSTEGELGALRKASVKWQCWSLEQVEFFEKFFMKLGATILLEFGWSTGKYDEIVLYDVSTNDATTESITDALKNGKKKSLQSGGKYECLSGIISNFNWSMNDAGGFDCETEIMTHGEAMVGARTNDSPFGVGELSDDQKEALGANLEEIEQQSVNNLQKHLGNIDDELYALITDEDEGFTYSSGEVNGISRLIYPGTDDKPDVIDIRGMDWSPINDVNNVFVTWGWMEDNILSKYLGRASEDYRIKYTIRSVEYNGSSYESVRVSNHPIFSKEAGKVNAQVATISDGNEAYQAYNFAPFLDREDDLYSGNLRNIIVNTRAIKRAFMDVNNFGEGMEKLFKEISYAFYGMFDFKIQVDPDNPTNMKVIDVNHFKKDPYELLANPSTPDNPTSVFILPIHKSKNNIVKGQEMESKVPSEGMYAALGGANKPSKAPDSGDQATGVAAKVQQDMDDGLFDPLMFGINLPDRFSQSNRYGNLEANPDNDLEATTGPPITKNAKTDLEEGWQTQNLIEDGSDPNEADKFEVTSDTTKDEYWSNLSWSEWGSAVFGKIKNVVKSPWASIGQSELVPTWEISYWMKMLQIGTSTNPVGTLQEPVMIPLEVSFELDGIAGIFPGNYIHTSYIPKKYQDRTILMVKGVSHNLTSAGWSTTLETIMVAAFSRSKQNPYGDETNPPPTTTEEAVKKNNKQPVKTNKQAIMDEEIREGGSDESLNYGARDKSGNFN